MINPISTTIPFSEACERNKYPILDCIAPYLKSAKSVLEIGTGTGQHAIYFAQQLPNLEWQTSDQEVYLPGIAAQLNNAKLTNLATPICLDVNQSPWFKQKRRFDAVYTANTFHIMNEADIQQFFKKLPKVMTRNFSLIVYGPFKYAGKFTSQSNAEFDQRLRDRGVGSGIRDFEWIDSLARECGLSLREDRAMPANNQCLVWQTS